MLSRVRHASAARPLARAFRVLGARWHGDHLDSPGEYSAWSSDRWSERNWDERAFTVGIGGPVGSGKTALVLQLCRRMRESRSLGVVTNDIFTREDAEFLSRHEALEPERIKAVETGGCPHAAIREDCSANLAALESITATARPELLLCESGGESCTRVRPR